MNFPREILKNLLATYNGLFNEDKLENELKVLYSDKSLLGNSDNLRDMVKFVVHNSLQDDIPEVYRLLCLILSLPATSASVERSFSCLKRIKTNTRNTICQDRLNNLSAIAIEKEFTKKLKENPIFLMKLLIILLMSKRGELN